MELFEHIDPERLSHAYLIEGEHVEVLPALRILMKQLAVTMKANPDYHENIHDVFTIDDARDLREAQSFHGAFGAKKIFIVLFNTIGHEAQNALLKTLEEPTAGTHFFFVVRSVEMLLPTMRSRMQVIQHQSSVISHQSSENIAEKFLCGTIAERMKMIEPMTKAKTDDKPKAKEEARKFLAQLEPALYREFQKATVENSDRKVSLGNSLWDIVVAKKELTARAPSTKLLLEHLALTVSRVHKEL